MSTAPGKNLEHLGIAELSHLFDKKQLSPVELTEYLLKYIDERNQPINAFVAITPELAKEQAKKAEKRMRKGERKGFFDGIPFGVKDLIFTKDAPTTAGSNIYKDFRPAKTLLWWTVSSMPGHHVGKNKHRSVCPVSDGRPFLLRSNT